MTATACTRASMGPRSNCSPEPGLDWSHRYKRTIEALRSLRVKSAYLDGELCALVAFRGFAKNAEAATCRCAWASSLAQTRAHKRGNTRTRLVRKHTIRGGHHLTCIILQAWAF
jgi:hypothetical protein